MRKQMVLDLGDAIYCWTQMRNSVSGDACSWLVVVKAMPVDRN